MIRDIRMYGDPVLREDCDPVEQIDASVTELITDLRDTMYDADGIGLAAPQVGVPVRVFVYDIRDPEVEPGVLVNPEITMFSDDRVPYDEGCLSVPGITEVVERPRAIRFRYRDLDGRDHERQAEGLLARVVQHEIDHLDGILFVDRLSLIKKQLLRKKLRLMAATQGS